ncbi:MAG: 2-deoxy-D-gluconate 3-dehydrogenase, partial [Alteromonas macleodii]
MVNFSLEGKTALVTGASRGIGQALALALDTSGAFVICASSRPGGCDETLRKIQSEGGQAIALDADLADADEVVKLAEDALSIKGHIDILLNNGGTIFRA